MFQKNCLSLPHRKFINVPKKLLASSLKEISQASKKIWCGWMRVEEDCQGVAST